MSESFNPFSWLGGLFSPPSAAPVQGMQPEQPSWFNRMLNGTPAIQAPPMAAAPLPGDQQGPVARDMPARMGLLDPANKGAVDAFKGMQSIGRMARAPQFAPLQPMQAPQMIQNAQRGPGFMLPMPQGPSASNLQTMMALQRMFMPPRGY